jgi:hypothetical protein
MTDTDKLIALQDLMGEVLHTLEMTQYVIEDGSNAHEVTVRADAFYQQMLDIVYA